MTVLPISFANLKNLNVLDIGYNDDLLIPEWIGYLKNLNKLDIRNTKTEIIPESLSLLIHLKDLSIGSMHHPILPHWIGEFKELYRLKILGNKQTILPDNLASLTLLSELLINGIQLPTLPEWIGNFAHLKKLVITRAEIKDLPFFILNLRDLQELDINHNPLNPELAAAYDQGLDAVKSYLRSKAEAQVVLNEAKLILVGEGEVGKSCLLGALRDDEWVEGLSSTHGIDIKPIEVVDQDTSKKITLNGWDFGGQRVYRPTHQLFFSSPAVYLVVWKPREGPQQGFVKEWIKLIKHREPEAKILVVATHGGPGGRQPDIDRQELWDLFGKETIIDFFHVESKPDTQGIRRGIEELRIAIASVASSLPEMGRSAPKRWQEVREALAGSDKAYMPLDDVIDLCRAHKMDNAEADLFVTISHRLGHLIHYEHDPALRDIVVLKPDWLATAISFVLDDETTRNNQGMVRSSRLHQLWNDPTRSEEFRYPDNLHPIFLRLMERFDLSYRIADLTVKNEMDETSLIAQLVPDNRPETISPWPNNTANTDIQQVQICRIVDTQKGQSATAEGLFYQLIVRLHKYSLGRKNYRHSIHWQRGLVLDGDYNGHALLEHIGNDVRITVRAAYPERFLSMLTEEVKYLVDSFWNGLRCDVMVPCLNPNPCAGLFEVRKLIENKQRNRPEQPCPICNEWQNIDELLLNAPAAKPVSTTDLIAQRVVHEEIRKLRHLLVVQHVETLGRFNNLDAGQRELLSKADAAYVSLLQALTDEAKEGPRLFSLAPIKRSGFNPRNWTSAKFRLILWCEHSRLPLPVLNGKDKTRGMYEIEITREWFQKTAPFLKILIGTLSLVLPVASSSVKLVLDDSTYKAFENYLDFGKEVIDASLSGSEKIVDWLDDGTSTDLEQGKLVRAQGAILREFHALLKAKDPASSFGGLVRVRNKRQEFMWVHERFEGEY